MDPIPRSRSSRPSRARSMTSASAGISFDLVELLLCIEGKMQAEQWQNGLSNQKI